MEYFLRFTENEKEDMDSGCSFFKNTDEKLAGLCGFQIADSDEEFSKLNVKTRVSQFQNNFGYNSKPVIFRGEYIGQGPVEGCLFEPVEII